MKFENEIEIKGARVNNLKNIDLNLPIKKITCFCGPSGSGKTSLAFHTIMTESKRRFLNSFPTYLKFFSDRPAPVDVDSIAPVLPVFGLPQINPIVGARSVVSDVMQVTEVLHNLYGAYAKELCPIHKLEPKEEVFSKFLNKTSDSEVYHLFIFKTDYLKIYPEGPFPNRSVEDDESMEIHDFDKNDDLWELLRFKNGKIEKLDEAVKNIGGLVKTFFIKGSKDFDQKVYYEPDLTCPECDYKGNGFVPASHFSPYNAIGACPHCNGFGATLDYDNKKLIDEEKTINEGGLLFLEYKRFTEFLDRFLKVAKKNNWSLNTPIKNFTPEFYDVLWNGEGSYPGYQALIDYLESKKYKASTRIFIRGIQTENTCKVCEGSRINPKFQNYYLNPDFYSYKELWKLSLNELENAFKSLEDQDYYYKEDAKKLVKKVMTLSELARGIGLSHLDLSRKTKSVSAGEYQRLLMLKYLSYEGTDSLFVFDEPSLGMNEGEGKMLFSAMERLKEQGNTILLIDHSEEFQKMSDEIVLMGPGAGFRGGEVLYQGKFKGSPLDFKKEINVSKIELKKPDFIEVKKPVIHHKSFKDFKIVQHGINWAHGPSGSGKTSCLVDILGNYFLKYNLKTLATDSVGSANISGGSSIKDVLVVNSDLNRFTSRSTVGSLTELFSIVRKHYLKTPFAKSMGLKEGHLSSNSELGQCPTCEGRGYKVIEMQFLEDIILECEDCKGKKIKPLYANISDGKMTLTEAYNNPISEVFKNIQTTPKFKRILDYMDILNLSYLSLDRQVNSLSGGEKQRLYLLSKVIKKLENTLIILENISFGLSYVELEKLMIFLKKLTESGNTVIVIDPHPIFRKIQNNEVHF